MSDKFTPRVLRNDRSNATITTSMSDREAFERYLDAYGDSDHWLLFWLHKTVEGLPSRDADQCLDYVCDWFLFAVVRGEVKAIHYRSPDGIKLVIAND